MPAINQGDLFSSAHKPESAVYLGDKEGDGIFVNLIYFLLREGEELIRGGWQANPIFKFFK